MGGYYEMAGYDSSPPYPAPYTGLGIPEEGNVSDAGKRVTASQNPACTNACTNLHELAKIVAAWPSLPAAIRRAILALIS